MKFYFQIESFQSFMDEASAEILPEHWEDLALDKDKVPLDPQWNVYLEREAKGELLMMVMRTEPPDPYTPGEIAGYFIGFIAPGLHYRTCLTCTMDIFFVRPRFRGGRAGVRLFRAVERELRTRGVDRWFVGSKLHKDVGRLFEGLGFEPVEMYFSKWIGG